MRFFLCASGDSTVAIPMTSVSSLMLHPCETSRALWRDKNGNTFFSLPHLFNLEHRGARHGIVLKKDNQEYESDCVENAQVILTESVDREIDISEDMIFALPKTLKNIQASSVFFGVMCENNGIVLFIDPERLTSFMSGAYAVQGDEEP
jgi:hypothetical protein